MPRRPPRGAARREHIGQRVRSIQIAFPVGRDNAEGRLMRRTEQVPQQQQRRPIRPMQILEHEQQRPGVGDSRDQRRHGLEQPVASSLWMGLGRVRRERDPPAERRHELRQLPHAVDVCQLGLEHVERRFSRIPLECFDEGLLRNKRLLIAASEQDGRIRLEGASELHDQPGLANAWFAGDQRQLPAAGTSPLPGAVQLTPLLFAAGQNNLTGPNGSQGRRGCNVPGRRLPIDPGWRQRDIGDGISAADFAGAP